MRKGNTVRDAVADWVATGNLKDCSLQEMGDRLGVSRQRIAQVLGLLGHHKPTVERLRLAASPKEHRPTIAETFGEHVDYTGDCWLWMGSTYPNGYGRFRFRGKMQYTHRWAYEAEYGSIPEDKPFVCHSCDVNYPVGDITYRRCVRPEHLFAGTPADNVHDAQRKGRRPSGRARGGG